MSEKLQCSKYESLVQKYEPLANIEHISNVFEDLQSFLLSSIDQIIEKQKKDTVLTINHTISLTNSE